MRTTARRRNAETVEQRAIALLRRWRQCDSTISMARAKLDVDTERLLAEVDGRGDRRATQRRTKR